MEGTERLRRLLLARKYFLTKSRKPRSYYRIGQGFHDRGIEFGDHILGRASGHPKPMPKWQVKPRRSGRPPVTES